MADSFFIFQETFNEFLSELPSELADKLKKISIPVLGDLAWTEIDAGMAFDNALEQKNITLSNDEKKRLKDEFFQSNFSCDWGTEKVNEDLSEMAYIFLETNLPTQN